jgi:hypothetical protein
MQNLGWLIIAAVLASAAFYLPLLLLWIVLGPDWAAVFLIPLAFGLPLLLSYVCQRFRRLEGTGSASTAYAMILGTWALGPLWLWVLIGSGKALLGFHEVLEFPIYTFIESPYAGLLWALLLTTILLLVCAMGRGPFRSVAIEKPEPSPGRGDRPNA